MNTARKNAEALDDGTGELNIKSRVGQEISYLKRRSFCAQIHFIYL